MIAKVRLALVVASLIGAVGYLAFLGFSTTWQYYVLVDECQERSDQFEGKRLRVSGKVASGSLQITENRREASFVLDGEKHRIAVVCSGPLPDNLAERMDVVVEGVLQSDGHLQGQKVITRCASKYAPEGAAGSPGKRSPA
ncbi:MAG: cytochrome c maturation protein CcmE [Gemmataceae bacterium]